MQNLQPKYEEIFVEIKNLLAELQDSASYEMLLSKENHLNKLYQKFAYLKISTEFDDSPEHESYTETFENEETSLNSDLTAAEEFDNQNNVAETSVTEDDVHDIFEDVPEVEEVHSFKEIDEQEDLQNDTVEEVSDFKDIDSEQDQSSVEDNDESFDRAQNQSDSNVNKVQTESDEKELEEEITDFGHLDQDNTESELDEILSDEELTVSNENNSDELESTETHESREDDFVEEENLLQDHAEKLEPMQDSQFSFAMEKEEIFGEKPEDDYEARLAEKEAKLKELEEKRRQIVEFSKENTANPEKPKQESEQELQEKKFKLANIKGLKIAKSLFDDDHLEDLVVYPPKQDPGSLLKNNVPTDYMEAPKPKPEFKLDLNDRIAFSQHLFDGSQSELNQVVATLNSFNSLDKAQEFLSDVYYERDWKKVDNYAQRLWSLVENRFL
jgi:hypothetical protein